MQTSHEVSKWRSLAFLGVLLLGLSCRPARATTQNLTQLITNARTLALDGASSSRQRFQDSQILEFLNQGQQLAIAQTDCLLASFTFTLTAGTTYYPMPSNFSHVWRVWRLSNGVMTEMSPEGLDGRSRGWNTVGGTPNYYFVDFSSRAMLGFAPFPAATSDTDTVTVTYEIEPTDLSSGSDLPYNSVSEFSEFYFSLSYYAGAIMTAIDGDMALSQAYMGIYNGAVTQLGKSCRNRKNYRPSQTGVP